MVKGVSGEPIKIRDAYIIANGSVVFFSWPIRRPNTVGGTYSYTHIYIHLYEFVCVFNTGRLNVLSEQNVLDCTPNVNDGRISG